MQQYLAARQAGDEDKAYALLSAETQAQFPAAGREQMSQSLTDPNTLKTFSPALLPVLALFADLHDRLHFKFRVLGPAAGDPAVVRVRAYQAGKPLSSAEVIQVVTAADPSAPDPSAPDALRLDGLKTATRADPSVAGDIRKAQRAVSLSNLRQLALGILQYAQDNNEKMPDADRWVAEIMPYVKNEAVFRDPSAPAEEKWSYAFNQNLSGVTLSEIELPAQTVLLFESDSGKKNASDTGDSVPVPGRHDGGTDYVFADGHAKWLAGHAPVSYSLHGN